MHAGPRGAAELDEQGDGLVLGLGRARAQVGAVFAGIEALHERVRRLDRAGQLGVDEERRARAGELAHGLAQIALGDEAELFDARLDHEALEAHDARVEQGAQLLGVAGDGAAPEAHVDPELPRGGGELLLEAGDGGGGRDAVERHVHQGGDAARRRGARGAAEALPLGAAGLVDVHVRVDDAGHDHQVSGVDHRATGGNVVVRGDLGDDAVAHVDGEGRHRAGRDDAATAEHEVQGRSHYAWDPSTGERAAQCAPLLQGVRWSHLLTMARPQTFSGLRHFCPGGTARGRPCCCRRASSRSWGTGAARRIARCRRCRGRWGWSPRRPGWDTSPARWARG